MKNKAYRGYLNSKQIAQGMNAAEQNARRLLDDACLLLANQRIPSALALTILSIEELGKTAILRQISISTSDKELKEQWNRFSDHREKNLHWLTLELINKGARQWQDFAPMTDKNSNHSYKLDKLKQISLYTDCIGDGNWLIPEDVVDKEFVESLIQVAKVLSVRSEHSELEIDLWIKHLGPVPNQSQEQQTEALYNWFNEMQTQGLIEEGQIKFKDFLGK